MQYILFEVNFKETLDAKPKLLERGILSVLSFDPESEKDKTELLDYIGQNVVRFIVPEDADLSKIDVRYKEVTQDEYEVIIAESEERKKKEREHLPYA